MFDRRSFLLGAAALGLVLAVPGFALAQETVDTAALYAAPQLGDKVLGKEDAPVTVVEYASMTCPHCAHFHNTTLDAFKEKYVDTGKVRFIFREFPLDTAAFGIAMIARCAPAERYFDIVDVYFDQQQNWGRAEKPYDAILDIAKQFGFSKESFDACLSNQALFDGLNAEKERATKEFGVDATPTFFINGKRISGALTLEELDKEIEPLL
ncbi:DsbA family protein [Propylenella binzhouense]|uniref:DsbA family protein n=1 Tax=Propylenella binzhouense TaxID=2555902 RepID=A0A964T570_9HYPH|nr:thioredoxin domain-containing protein [Propylenella binzhouense]MYZ48579.1 DsbA family protein [Propylenella binzhouense]